jgi:hypothetical protein
MGFGKDSSTMAEKIYSVGLGYFELHLGRMHNSPNSFCKGLIHYCSALYNKLDRFYSRCSIGGLL